MQRDERITNVLERWSF